VPPVCGFASFNTHGEATPLENSGDEPFDGFESALVHGSGLTQSALPLGVFLGQNVLAVAPVPLDLAGAGRGEPFGSTFVGFQLRHTTSCDDLIIYRKNGCL
jgi:hypothetical protein